MIYFIIRQSINVHILENIAGKLQSMETFTQTLSFIETFPESLNYYNMTVIYSILYLQIKES